MRWPIVLTWIAGCTRDPLAGLEEANQAREAARVSAIAAARAGVDRMLAATHRIATTPALPASDCKLPASLKVARLHTVAPDSDSLLAYRGDLGASPRPDRRYLHADAILLPACAAIVRDQPPPITRHRDRKDDEHHVEACARATHLLVIDETEATAPRLAGPTRKVGGKQVQYFEPGAVRGTITLYEFATGTPACTVPFAATGIEPTVQLGPPDDRHHVFLVEAVEQAINRAIAGS